MKSVPHRLLWVNQGILFLTASASVITGSCVWLAVPFFIGIATLRTGHNPLAWLPLMDKDNATSFRRTDFLHHQFNQWMAVAGSGGALYASYIAHTGWMSVVLTCLSALWAFFTFFLKISSVWPAAPSGR